ncbi:MAG: glucokinase [Betaproteobacteria bacterium]|nr:glucokinase [Betaproteobacteria bacterium]
MAETSMVLAGDVGGTKSALALVQGSPASPVALMERTYANQEFASLEEVVRRFLADTGCSPATACFGVAGAVMEGRTVLPNLGWRLSEEAMARSLNMKAVTLINDLEANALGIATLGPEQLFTLNAGQPGAKGNRALISAGTGLGEALLIDVDGHYRVSASEGGHVDFAPRSEEQMALLRWLSARYGHVSVERVLSGPGLANLYAFLRDVQGEKEPPWLAEALKAGDDPAPAIAAAGLSGQAAIGVHALDMFLAIYGAAAGNLALKALSTGGLYIGGGIAPKLLEKFGEGGFMAAFVDKGRFSEMLARVPVRIILEPKTALRGAAARGLRVN